MITLITGQPGNGKTLYALWLVEKLRRETGREVWVHGVSGLTLPWRSFDKPEEWQAVPDGSIVVVDEAWKPFPTRRQGSPIPSYVEALATHRHRGIDLVLITQNRLQLDTFVRGLVGRHVDVVRKWGRQQATLFQWEKVSDTTSDKARAEALKTVWKYPREVFEWYRSAELHTVRADFPVRKVAAAVGLLGVVVALIWFAVHRMSRLGGDDDGAQVAAEVVRPVENQPVRGRALGVWSPEVRLPRLETVGESAPIYDELQGAIRSAPSVRGCMMLVIGSVVRCECTGPSGAVLGSVKTAQCVEYVKHGWFDPTEAYPSAEERREAEIARLNGLNNGASSSQASVGVTAPAPIKAPGG